MASSYSARTVASHDARSRGGCAAHTGRSAAVRSGLATPRNGISDFMYACIAGARAGIGRGAQRGAHRVDELAIDAHAHDPSQRAVPSGRAVSP